MQTEIDTLKERENTVHKDLEEKIAQIKELNSAVSASKRELEAEREQWKIQQNKLQFDLTQQSLEVTNH